MCKRKILILLTLIGTLLTVPAPGRSEVSYLQHSESSVVGAEAELGVSFLVEADSAGAEKVQIRLTDGRVMEVRLDRGAGTLSVKSYHEAGQEPAEISAADVAMARILLAELAQLSPSSPVELTLISSLNLLSEVRPGSTLDIQTRLEAGTGEKAIKSLCSSSGKRIKATYDDDERNKTFTETVLLGPCYNAQNSCLGRCGIGCGVLGSGVAQQLTQDCLNHDLCRLRTGANVTPPCDDEFVSASDDFFFAKDCASTTGPWKDEFKHSYKLSQAPSGLFTGQVIDPRCGTYRISGNHSDSKANFTASRFFPPSGCCSSFSFKGNYMGCDKVSGTWTNVCGRNGRLTMSRGKSIGTSQPAPEVTPFDMATDEAIEVP